MLTKWNFFVSRFEYLEDRIQSAAILISQIIANLTRSELTDIYEVDQSYI